MKYGTLMELQKQLRTAESSLQQKASSNGSRLLKEEVTEADIAEIISKWTGKALEVCHSCVEFCHIFHLECILRSAVYMP